MMRSIEDGHLSYCDVKKAAALTPKGWSFLKTFVEKDAEPPPALSIGGLLTMARLYNSIGINFKGIVSDEVVFTRAPALEMPKATTEIRKRLKEGLTPA